jgi:hypothetical protein
MKENIRLPSSPQTIHNKPDSDTEDSLIECHYDIPLQNIEDISSSTCKIGFTLSEMHKMQDLGIPDYFSSDKPDMRSSFEPEYLLNSKLPLRAPSNKRSKIVKQGDFEFWAEALLQNLNILLFGAGSKLSIVDGFQDYLQSESLNVIRVNGFNPTVTLRKVLNEILIFLDVEEAGNSNLDRLLTRVLRSLDESESEIFLLIDNIDSKAFIETETQTILSRLSSHNKLYLLATLDNPYLLYRWSIDTNMKYNFLYIPCVSLCDYNIELMYTDGLKFFDSAATFGQMRAVDFVLRSLTSNQRKILKELCFAITKNPNGIAFKDFLGICIEETLVINSKQLRDALVEAIDHQIAAYKQGSHGESMIILKLDPALLSNKINT